MGLGSVLTRPDVIAVVILYAALKYLFRKGLLPLPIAQVWGRVHFSVWRFVLEALYPYYRAKPWKEVRPNVFLGKCLLSRHVPVIKKLGITRVLNLQDEYEGPVEAYKKHGIEQLYIPVVDHLEPSSEQIHQGVEFIERALADNTSVYVHCQGGHGRSAAIVFGLLAHEAHPHKTPEAVNKDLRGQWKVRPGLHKQPSVVKFLKEKKERNGK